ncbi:MAG: hypothetical protein NO515_07190 [Candidatus Methanomethylicia archaeon]|nr:hypothetical protein [Candidatus Methanomethylicia archaeon]
MTLILSDVYKVVIIPVGYYVVTFIDRGRIHAIIDGYIKVTVMALAIGLLKQIYASATGINLRDVPFIDVFLLLVVLRNILYGQSVFIKHNYVLLTLGFASALMSLERALWALVPFALLTLSLVPKGIGRDGRSTNPRVLLRLLLVSVFALVVIAVAVLIPLLRGVLVERLRLTGVELGEFVSFLTGSGTIYPLGYLSVLQKVSEVVDSLAFLRSAGGITWVIGMGAGAEFPVQIGSGSTSLLSASGWNHQIHVTPIALLFRHGLLGVLVFYGMLASMLSKGMRFLKRGPGVDQTAADIAVVQLLVVWLIIQLVYGILINTLIGDITFPIFLALLTRLVKVKRV